MFNMKQPPLLQRLRAKKRSQAMIVGLTWYTEETWAQVKACATDPECFEDSFEKWKAMAVRARREFQRAGVRAIECHNATSRGEYVSEKLSASVG